MASSGKKKTTAAKLAREGRLRIRRLEKQAKKAARKRAAEMQPTEMNRPALLNDTPHSSDAAQPAGAPATFNDGEPTAYR